MTALPAQCMTCGHEFREDAFGFLNVEGITMSGNTTNCPRCGSPARIGEGIFDMRGGVIELVEGPAWTREALGRLQTAIEEARSRADHEPESAVASIADEVPSLRQKLWTAAGSGQLQNFLAALGIAVALLLGMNSLDDLTAEDVERIVERALEQDEKS